LPVSDYAHSEEDIFSEALAVVDPEKRQAFLSQACGADDALRSRIERLLKAAERSGQFFDHIDRADAEDAKPDQMGEKPGDKIGPYRLLERIGEGGFGAVYVAEQDAPIRRRVALKIIKLGMDTKQVIARFEAERQALALMDHPGIARIFDGGVVGEQSEIRNPKSELRIGRPYSVMELVRGVPITRFCDEQRFTPDQRLRLFMEVCEAVQHAHQKGIIHRDLKPSNILVTLHGRKAVPKVIDFGIAKATREPLTDKTIYTRFHQFIGTPEYVSPEQAEMSGLEIDTRSDIYSLGVLLYELLTGKAPFDSAQLLKDGYDQIQRVLRESDPPRPTTRLGRLEEADLTTTAARRRCVPQQLKQWLKGDLERVIMKAIERDVDRRYPSAAVLAEDVRRFLDHEPVTAVAPSRTYVLRKFVRRHRLAVAAGGLMAVSMVVGLGLALTGFFSARRANLRAQEEAAALNETLGFIQDDLLGKLDPFLSHDADMDWGRSLTLLEAVKGASERLEDRFADRPLVEARLRLTLGRTYLRLGTPELAGPHLERAVRLFTRELGPAPPQCLEAQHEYGVFLTDSRQNDEAVALHRTVLEARRSVFGEGDRRTLESITALATALTGSTAGYAEAEALFRNVISKGTEVLGSDDSLVLQAKHRLAGILLEGYSAESRRLQREVLEARRRALGSDHPEVILSEAEWAYRLRYSLGDLPAAEAMGREVLQRSARILGPDHPITLLMIEEEGARLCAKGLWGDAIESRRQILASTRSRYGSEHHQTQWAEDMLGGTLRFFGDYAQAETIHRASWEIRRRKGQRQTQAEQRSLRYLGWAVFGQGRVEEAEQAYRQVVAQSREAYGTNTASALFREMTLVELLGKQAKWPEIAKSYAESAAQDSVDLEAECPMGYLPVPAGVIASQLAGEPSVTRRLIALLIARHGQTTNPITLRETALSGLALPARVFDETQQRTIQRIAKVAGSEQVDEPAAALIGGMLAYRSGQWVEAIRRVQPLTQNPDHALASLAGYVQSMALFRQTLTEEARRALEQANQLLEVGLRPGLLGHRGQDDFHYDLRWLDYARALVVRAEAEALVLGEVRSPPVTSVSLVAKRKAWQPVQALLDEAEKHGRDRNWAGAQEAFAKALECGPLNWEEDGNFIPRLHEKAAAVFILTGESERYAALCRELTEHAALSQSYYGGIGLLATNRLPREITAKAIEMARWRAAQVANESTRNVAQDWVWLNLGRAEYRAGNLAAAVAALERARDAFNLNCAGTAQALLAMALGQTAKVQEAADSLARAEALRPEVLNGNADRLGQDWQQVAILELSLEEARRSLGGRP
jgi:serine/threonine protein kinase/tetratricopeptide (TPR) repeat protein